MPILRSNKNTNSTTTPAEQSSPNNQKTLKSISPTTPSKTHEKMTSNSTRRSTRLAKLNNSNDSLSVNENETWVSDLMDKEEGEEEKDDVKGESLLDREEKKGKRKLEDDEEEGERENGFWSLRSGKRVVKRGVIDEHLVEGERENEREEGVVLSQRKGRRLSSSSSSEEKGKGIVTREGEKGRRRFSKEEKGKNVVEFDNLEGCEDEDNKRVSLEEKRGSNGEGVLIDLNVIDLDMDSENDDGVELDNTYNSSIGGMQANVVDLEIGSEDEEELNNNNVGNGVPNAVDNSIENEYRRMYMERFRDIARRNATRFAHFSSNGEEEIGVGVPEINRGRGGEGGNNRGVEEDWPGPFSTAMKIIKDRTNKERGKFASNAKPEKLLWVPRQGDDHLRSRPMPPSLEELSMAVLAKNIDAVSSLECVPDILRHKLTQLLCDSRRMNVQFFAHLIRGSPTEVCVKDCSWLTEEQFTESFGECKTSSLTVLQLDQCGRCMPDYVLHTTLARSSNSLPVLTTLSLKGACRLSDTGLTEIVSSTPSLRSINLSQCSLLTSNGIEALADSLGSVLRELYLDDCQGIEAMLALPALRKLKYLEVLSLARFESISDDFIKDLMVSRGHNMKEIVLTDCVTLTDSSLKVIAEFCPGLCALDLINLCKLTDSGIGYLATGCLAIQTLKLRRNAFSDEAVAAFLETSGESLLELSLNNVNKVGRNTALSISKCTRKLVSLDLSWCRNLLDDALGLIVDSCFSLRVLKLFGCTQVTKTFLDGHSNPQLEIIGLKMTPILKQLKVQDLQQGPLRYSSVSSM